MLLYGASGHSKVIVSNLRASGAPVYGIFDDDPGKKVLNGIPVVGGYDAAFLPEAELIISIGYNDVRKRLAGEISHRFGRVFHPQVVVDEGVEMGEGSVALHTAVLQADVKIGRHVIINAGAGVGHDTNVEDFVHLGPGVILCGNITVGEGTFIGAGAIVSPNITIGRWAMIAAGSVITRSVPDYAIVRGNPGRIIKIQQPA